MSAHTPAYCDDYTVTVTFQRSLSIDSHSVSAANHKFDGGLGPRLLAQLNDELLAAYEDGALGGGFKIEAITLTRMAGGQLAPRRAGSLPVYVPPAADPDPFALPFD